MSNNTVVSVHETQRETCHVRFCLVYNHTCNHGWKIVPLGLQHNPQLNWSTVDCLDNKSFNKKQVVLLVFITRVIIIIIIVIIASLSSLIMNIINQLGCDSSSHSNGIVMEDQVAKEDSNCREITFDQVETSTSQTISIESDSSSHSGNSAVSLLSVLKTPGMSELSRKRKVVKNLPIGKKKAHPSCQSNPKGIKPQQIVKEYPAEPFIVSCGMLFCQGCREELPLKKSSLSIISSQPNTVMERKG